MSYIIEDNIDFYSMLHDNHTISNNIITHYDDNDDDDDVCLISNTKLTSNAIKLLCGHIFNYESIYREVVQQKKYKSGLDVVKLKEYQIKCPYCRTIQDKLLPFLKVKGVKRIFGVNHPIEKTMSTNICNYPFKSGKNKGKLCKMLCFFEYCNLHQPIIEKKKLKNKNVVENNNINNYEMKTVKQLHEIAKGMNIKKYYRMKKVVLIDAIQSTENSNKVIDLK
jgi:hypothetical protein